jgi:hypothetical protein
VHAGMNLPADQQEILSGILKDMKDESQTKNADSAAAAATPTATAPASAATHDEL